MKHFKFKDWLRLTLAIGGMAGLWLAGSGMINRAKAQTSMTGSSKGKKAGEFFKNVTTSTLKELSVDDFVAAMGVISDDLGLDCADCHPGAGSDNVNWVIDTPQKRTARRMVEMVASINKTNFAGTQAVTCWTCHHGRETPATSIALDAVYDTPNAEFDDVVRPDRTGPTAEQVLDKYITALGGAQKLNAITSFISSGESVGYEGLGGNGQFMLYAKAPNQRAINISFKDHPERGVSAWTFNGTRGWIATPRALLVKYEVEGTELDGARFEAQLAFPAGIKTALTNWRIGTRRVVNDHEYDVIQGSGPRGFLATMYFDPKTSLLARVVRYGPSPVGRIPVQIDYSDYRDVNGVKFPFEYTFLWLDGRYTAKVKDVKVNVAVDAAMFGEPK